MCSFVWRARLAMSQDAELQEFSIQIRISNGFYLRKSTLGFLPLPPCQEDLEKDLDAEIDNPQAHLQCSSLSTSGSLHPG